MRKTREENWERRKSYSPKVFVGGLSIKKAIGTCVSVAQWPCLCGCLHARHPLTHPGQGSVREIPSHIGSYKRHAFTSIHTDSHMYIRMYVVSTLSGLSLSMKRLFLSICWNVYFSFSSTGVSTKKDQKESCSFFRLAAVARRRSLSQRRVNGIVGRFTSQHLTSAKRKT